MAKFKPGDKVTWQHHNGSYSNEVIDYIVPPNGYAFKDGGIGAESEIRAGWVPESQTGRANMPPLNSRARNGVRSRNAVVAKALNACARNGGIDDFEVGDRVMVRSVVGFTPTDPKPGTVTAIYKSDNRIAVKKDDGGRGLFDASMVTKNACGTARNAKYKDFGQNVKAEIDDDGSCFIQLSLNGLISPYGKSWTECKAKAATAIKNLERKAAELKQAVAWFEQNAK